MLDRILEPELMTDAEQVRAYAKADFSEPHDRFINQFQIKFPTVTSPRRVVELGCGPGDILVRFARAFPSAHVLGVDGSPAMINYGRSVFVPGAPDVARRISFECALLPNISAEAHECEVILSNSLLHHLPDPMMFWELLERMKGRFIFVQDLVRPETKERAAQLVSEHAAKEEPILQRDFYHSLCAAFRVEEVREQLKGVPWLRVEQVDELHQVVWGLRPECKS